jgi:hypothetical protein
MAMKFFSFHYQFVSDFAPNNQDYHFVLLNIIQGPQISHAQLELSQGIWSQAFDRFRRLGRFVLKPR